jgi:hypothetical protein
MSCNSNDGTPAPDVSSSSQSGSNRHFDTFETEFFQAGDDDSARAVEIEKFDDLDEGAKHRRFAPSRRFMMSVAIGSACIAILGCIVLWRGSGRAAPPAVAAEAQVAPAPTVPAPVPAPAEPTQAIPAPVIPVPVIPVPVVAQAEPAPVPPLAAEQIAPALLAVKDEAKAAAAAPPVPAEKPTFGAAATETAVEKRAPAMPTADKPAEAKPAKDEPTLAATAPAAGVPVGTATVVRDRCDKAIRAKRGKEILVACTDAFAADPSAADVAVALAKTEFDRGRSAQAFVWGKKAIVADPNAAEAYVFIGGAEQNAGHGKAAKEAYKRYLQLAPGGRYASDLRAIVGSL